jgi:hypothetical protein
MVIDLTGLAGIFFGGAFGGIFPVNEGLLGTCGGSISPLAMSLVATATPRGLDSLRGLNDWGIVE